MNRGGKVYHWTGCELPLGRRHKSVPVLLGRLDVIDWH